MIIKVDEHIVLEPIDEKHAREMFELVNSNREHLREWLPWVDNMQSVEDYDNHIRYCRKAEAAQTDHAFVIMFDGKMAGRIGLHYIHLHNKIASIGYWLAAGFQGKAIISKSCIALINHAFDSLGMNRIEIKCGIGNHKSQAIPERLNFKKEGITRQGEFLNGDFIDLYLYAMLKEEWKRIN